MLNERNASNMLSKVNMHIKREFNFEGENQLWCIRTEPTGVGCLHDLIVNTIAMTKEEAIANFRDMGIPERYLSENYVVACSLRYEKTDLHYLQQVRMEV